MPSFDTVLEPNLVEVKNAVDQTAKEIGTRFDFKGSSARVELKEKELTVWADSDFQIGQVLDILIAKLWWANDPTLEIEKRNVERAIADIDALTKAGVPNQLHTVPGGGHGNFKAAERLKIYAVIREFLMMHRLL
jgi:uncharacterized protein YajQ (UPF0234 family)